MVGWASGERSGCGDGPQAGEGAGLGARGEMAGLTCRVRGGSVSWAWRTPEEPVRLER